MRKILLLILPVAIVSVISLSFYLLLTSDHSKFPVSQASAASRRQRIARLRLTPTPTITIKSLITPTPTLKPSATPTPILKPTATPTPTAKPTPTPTIGTTPTPTTTSPTSSDPIKDYIMQKINEFRASQGKGSVTTDKYTCDFAKVRAQEISNSFNHDGFSNRINNHTLPYPSYHEVTENIAMTSDYKEVVTMWANSPGHAENMRADTPYVCVEKFGDYYSYEGWRP